jgi:drug/metabolite transporter (DMT)-like permease
VATSGLLLALAAACVHATWNLLLARAKDTQAAGAIAICVGVIAFAPVAASVWRVEPAAWKYIVTSGCFELAYWSLLATAYRRAELSVVYPVGRGLAPLLVLAIGVSFLGTKTSWLQGAGVCLVAVGIVLVRGFKVRADRIGLLFGVGIAGCIAAYTLVDKHGIQHANPIAYLEMDLLFPAVGYGVTVFFLKGLPAIRRELGVPIVLAGLGTFSGYLLVLLALRIAPAAPVSAVRETSVVIAAVLARIFLRERVTRGRLAGAALVAAGIALLSF